LNLSSFCDICKGYHERKPGRTVVRKFFRAFLQILICLSSWQAFAVEPFNDQPVRAVREAIGSTKIAEWKRQARTDWDAIAILNQAKQWPGILSDDSTNPLDEELKRVYSEIGCGTIKEFVVRLTAGILLGNGFKNGVVKVTLPHDQFSTYHETVRDISQHISATGLTEAHIKTNESAGNLRGHVDAVNSLFAPADHKIDPVKVVIPGPVAVSAIPAAQAVAIKYVDADLNADSTAFLQSSPHTEIVFEYASTRTGSIEAAINYPNPAVVVFANTSSGHLNTQPSDGHLPNNQESCIFRCTDASRALATKKELWPFHETGGIYARGINILRTASTNLVSFRQAHPQGYPIGLIFSAAPSSGAPSAANSAAFSDYRELINKIVEHQFIMAIMNGHDTLITGNFGLGIFKNNGDVVADAYINCLRNFNGRIARVVFTYLDPNSTSYPEVAKFGRRMEEAKAAIEQERRERADSHVLK
jgi:ribonucleotide reductase alpha subunit